MPPTHETSWGHPWCLNPELNQADLLWVSPFLRVPGSRAVFDMGVPFFEGTQFPVPLLRAKCLGK